MPLPPPARRLHGRAERHRLRRTWSRPPRNVRTGATAGWPSGSAPRARPCSPSDSRCSSGAGTHRTRRGPGHPVAGPQLPQVQFVMGGTHGDAFPSHEVPDNVVFTGQVIERVKRTLLAAADVALNPVLHGSGTNLKVIEYLASGVPVVSTAFGVRGLEVGNGGEHLLVADPTRWSRRREGRRLPAWRAPSPAGPGHRALRLGRPGQPARPRGAAGPALRRRSPRTHPSNLVALVDLRPPRQRAPAPPRRSPVLTAPAVEVATAEPVPAGRPGLALPRAPREPDPQGAEGQVQEQRPRVPLDAAQPDALPGRVLGRVPGGAAGRDPLLASSSCRACWPGTSSPPCRRAPARSSATRSWCRRSGSHAILPLASMGAAMVHFALQMIVLAGAMAVFQRSPNLAYFPRSAWPSSSC